MRSIPRAVRQTAGAVVGLAIAAAGASAVQAQAPDKAIVMKLSTATLNDSQHEWMKVFAAAVEKRSGGRIKGEVYAASQLGPIPRQIESAQFGAIQAVVFPPEFFVGVDSRFEVLSAPGLIKSEQHAVRFVADPEIKKMMAGLGEKKGLVGIGLFISGASSINSRKPIASLADIKGMKIRVLASPFQNEFMNRLGATPVAMTLGDVLPAIQQGTIDGALSTLPVFTGLRYYDVAKYMTVIKQPFVFSVTEVSKKWLDGLPKDLQAIVTEEGDRVSTEIYDWQKKFFAQQTDDWKAKGGIVASLPPADEAELLARVSSVGPDIAKSNPALTASLDVALAASKRTE